MATRSTITLVSDTKNGQTFRTIYCHWDGYIGYNGIILVNHYNTIDKVEKLLDLGSLSSLAPNLSTDKKHTFDNPVEGVCVAYGRDRGETGVEATNSFIKVPKGRLEQYNYYFRDGEWYVTLGQSYNMGLVKETEEYKKSLSEFNQ